MATTINADTTNGLVLTPDTSGDINLQSAGVTKASITSAGLTVGGSNISPQPTFRNRIINGNMTIDQRNAGASVTPTTDTYTLDRWVFATNVASKASVQQNAGSVTPPDGYKNYLGITSTSAYTSLGATDVFVIRQRIEGYNVADLGFGTATAKTVTLSFWVRSSLTGTFAGSLNNGAENRSYPFSYSIPVANTWTQIAITIAGDTTGTWLTTSGHGLEVGFSMGMGSTFSGAVGSWSGSTYFSATSATSVVGTSGATFYITGVQLEVGEQASDFEFLPYDVQLQRCQRYYEKSCAYATVPNNGVYDVLYLALSYYIDNLNCLWQASFKVEKRATPTLTLYGGATSKWQTAKLDGSWGTILGSTYAVSLTSKYATVNNSDWNGSSSWQTITAGTGRMTRGIWVVESEL